MLNCFKKNRLFANLAGALAGALADSYKLFYANKKEFAKIMLSELLFFIGLSTVFYFIVGRLVSHIRDVSMIFAVSGIEQATNAGEEALKNFAAAFPAEAFFAKFTIIIRLFLLLVIISLVLWLVFKGYCWKKTHELCNRDFNRKNSNRQNPKKLSWKKFYISFTLLTLFWMVLAMLFVVFGVKLSSAGMPGIFEFIMSYAMKIIISAVMVLLCYFGLVSYSIMGNLMGEKTNKAETLARSFFSLLKKTFIISFRRFNVLFPIFALILVKIYIALLLVKNSLLIAFWLPALIFVFVFLPVLAWGRAAVIEGTRQKV